MNYLKLFSSHTDYEDYASGGTMVRPNVSYCKDVKDVHYNPWVETRLIATYIVQDASTPTQLYMYMSGGGMTVIGANMFSNVEIDGTEVSVSDLDAVSGTCELSSGEHTVKYTLINPTTIGINTQTMEYGALFLSCNSITNVIIPNSVTSINANAFYGCNSLISATMGNSVTSIGFGAFQYCNNLLNINTLNGVTNLGEQAFMGCNSLTNIDMPNITSIEKLAFIDCSGLTNVTIGNTITSIGNNAFNGCSGLTSITVLATTPPTLGENAFASTNNCPIYIPSESIESYMSSWAWYVATSRLYPI